ncbi:MAG: FtsK/SpoIIIE domain-containing protein [bacterium]|nr:FtsK/SpoIIIE domain-containing protein [bacterium]
MDKVYIELWKQIDSKLQEQQKNCYENMTDSQLCEEKEKQEKEMKTTELTIEQLRRVYSSFFHETLWEEPIADFAEKNTFEEAKYARKLLEQEFRKPFLLAPPSGIWTRKPKKPDYQRAVSSLQILKKSQQDSIREIQIHLSAKQHGSQNPEDILMRKIKEIQWNHSGGESGWKEYKKPDGKHPELYLGDILEPLEDNYNKNSAVSQRLSAEGMIFDKWIRKPFYYSAYEPFLLFIEEVVDPLHKQEYQPIGTRILRNLIYQIVHGMPAYSYEIFYLDLKREGKFLEEFQELSAIESKNAFWMEERIFNHTYKMFHKGLKKNDCQECLEKLTRRIADINEWYWYEAEEGIAAYNRKQMDETGTYHNNSQLIPQQFLIFDNTYEALDSGIAAELNKIAVNAKNCGISMLIYSRRNENEKMTQMEQRLQDEIGLDKLTISRHGCSMQIDGKWMGREKEYLFYGFEPASEVRANRIFFEQMRETVKPRFDFNTDFKYRFDLDGTWGNKYAERSIEIPVGINEKGELVYTTLGDSDGAHGMLAGGTGCGKSTYLQGIIGSIIMSYRPEDVQIWISDYKSNEFQIYMKNTPAHITYISSLTTKDYSLAFLKRIEDEIRARQTLFREIADLPQYRRVHGKYALPRILIIIDEFHKMANHVIEEPRYKRMLSELLREARAFGITFLLSDQTCEAGLGGLSEDARMQLARRMAMVCADPKEYKAVFNIENKEMEQALPSVIEPYQIVIRKKKEITNRDGETKKIYFYQMRQTLYIDHDVTIPALQKKALEKYGEAKAPVFFVEGRVEANWKKIAEQQEKKRISIFLGKPKDLSETLCVTFFETMDNNLMSVGRSKELQISIFYHALESIRRSGKLYEIYLMADEFDSLYQSMEPFLEHLAKEDAAFYLVNDMEKICETIPKLLETMKRRRRQRNVEKKIFIFWLGIADMMQEFADYPKERPGMGNIEKESLLVRKVSSTPEEEWEKYFGSSENTPSDNHPNLIGMEEEEEWNVYDAADDMVQLLEGGAKQGMFSLCFYTSYIEFKRIRRIKKDYFVHKIAFGMGTEDAVDYIGNSRDVKDTEGNIMDAQTALYSNGEKAFQFQPYLVPKQIKSKNTGGNLE